MGKKFNRTPKTQARHDKNVRKSSKGKFKTAAEMMEYGRKNKAAKKKETADSAG